MAITLDGLPTKRVLALEEGGTEHLPPELSLEEKPLALLSRIDFGQEAKKVKSENGNKEKEEETVQVWPWQGLVDHLQQAHQELAIILDLINHVESNEVVTVASMVRPKLLPHETCSDLALRASSKLHHFRNVGKYLKRSAQALERQVEREAVFYGALMRIILANHHPSVKQSLQCLGCLTNQSINLMLIAKNVSREKSLREGRTEDINFEVWLQRNWKVKRQRGVAAGPGGSAGFSIDVGTTDLAPCIVTIDQDSAGLLVARPQATHALTSLHVTLNSRPPQLKSEKAENFFSESSTTVSWEMPEGTGVREAPKGMDRGIGEGVDKGATSAQAVLRKIQAANFDEQVFEWVGREALLLSPSINVTGLSDRCLQLSLGHATTLTLHLSPTAEDSQVPVKEGWQLQQPNLADDSKSRSPPNESSLGICLQQAYQQFISRRLDSVSSKENAKGKDGHSEAAEIVKHLSAIMCHRVTCQKVISVLEKLVHGVLQLRLLSHPTWYARVSAWDLWLDIPETTTVCRWQASIVLREDVLTIAGLPPTDGYKQALPMSCTLSELSPFLLYQMAGQLVAWLHAEATGMGAVVRRDLLSITFDLDNYEDVALVASPDVKLHTVNWILRTSGSRLEDFEDSQRFLGSLPLEILQGIVVDLITEKLEPKVGGDQH